MKISPLTITSILIFAAFLGYQYLVQEGLCIDSGQLWCGPYYMGDIMRFGYFFLTFAATSLIIDNFFMKYRKKWLIFSSVASVLVFFGLIKINSDIFHADLSNGSGLGWASILDNFIDKAAALGLYLLFVIGSAVTVFVSYRKTKNLMRRKSKVL